MELIFSCLRTPFTTTSFEIWSNHAKRRWQKMSDILPSYTTPRALAKRLTASPRIVSDTVRELGGFCKIGQKVIMLDHHVVTFMEAMECRSKSSNGTSSIATGAQFPVGDYEALREQRIKGLPKGSQQKSKQKRGKVILMDRAQR